MKINQQLTSKDVENHFDNKETTSNENNLFEK